MSDTLGIICCDRFSSEAEAAIAREGWDDVTVTAFPSRCGCPPVSMDELRAVCDSTCSQLLIGSACLPGSSDPPESFPPIRSVRLEHCFHLTNEETVPAALDQFRHLLVRAVLEWRLESVRRSTGTRERQHAAELADHVSAMDMLKQLAQTVHEPEAISAIGELFRMLFAPAELYYLSIDHGLCIPERPIPADMRAALHDFHDDYSWTPDGQGFLLRIGHGDEVVGKVSVDRLAFPEYRERYLNMALAVTGVCGLAIVNARNRKKLLEAEKMASLGIMVAGVAHEINTPLGVVLTAATAMQKQSRHLAQLFSERSMTQEDLEHYLASAGTGTALICHNMERIGYLTDTFRQVAVQGTSQELQRVNLYKCLEDVIRSLGDHFPAERISLDIQCDPDLEIRSLVGDWVSVFLNLIQNSIKHGFNNEVSGTIAIAVTIDGSLNMLNVDYRDDGSGMAPEVLTRLFDPFFTTDLQRGMGLGMHLVYNLITHRFGGSITCESHPGQGVFFHIEVPL